LQLLWVAGGFVMQLGPSGVEYLRRAGMDESLLDAAGTLHAGYALFAASAIYILAFLLLSACSALFAVGVYSLTRWLLEKSRSIASVLPRLVGLFALALSVDVLFVIALMVVSLTVGRLVGLRLVAEPEMLEDVLKYQVGIRLSREDHPTVGFNLGFGFCNITVFDIKGVRGERRPSWSSSEKMLMPTRWHSAGSSECQMQWIAGAV
jgi:hypothetical protein